MMVQSRASTYIVIPAYNEAPIIKRVVEKIRHCGYHNIIVVDDGSRDTTYSQASSAGAIVLSHRINRGKGAATKTGIEAAKALDASVVVTIDGDGQHEPSDIDSLVEPINTSQCDVALGTRLKRTHSMPATRILGNHVANAVTWSLYGLWVRDSQSGFRAYSRRALDRINTTADLYDYESEVIKEIHTFGLVYKEVPISVQYTDYSMHKSHGQGAFNALKTLYKMVWKVISF